MLSSAPHARHTHTACVYDILGGSMLKSTLYTSRETKSLYWITAIVCINNFVFILFAVCVARLMAMTASQRRCSSNSLTDDVKCFQIDMIWNNHDNQSSSTTQSYIGCAWHDSCYDTNTNMMTKIDESFRIHLIYLFHPNECIIHWLWSHLTLLLLSIYSPLLRWFIAWNISFSNRPSWSIISSSRRIFSSVLIAWCHAPNDSMLLFIKCHDFASWQFITMGFENA